MPKLLTIGNEEFEFPLDGENPGYGSEVTDWAEAVTVALETVQKPNDIPTTSEISLNADIPVTIPATTSPIPGFSFSTAEVIAIEAKYLFKRTYTIINPITSLPENIVSMEVGFIEGYFDGNNWGISVRTTGDAGVLITINPSGQMLYQSTLAFPVGATNKNLSIVYEAKVINN
jgi:hypothetical protein